MIPDTLFRFLLEPGRDDIRRRTTDTWIVVAVAMAAYFIYALAWPLAGGRDFGTYLNYYLDFFNSHPLYPSVMLFRTPVIPFFLGGTLQYLGVWGAEVLMGVMFCLVSVGIYRMGCTWGRRTGFLAALAVVLNVQYGAIFRTLSSDAPFSFLWIMWVWFTLRLISKPSPGRWIVNGLFVGALVLTRPSSEPIIPVFACVSFLFLDERFRKRMTYAVLFLVVALSFSIGWRAHNLVRYGQFTFFRISPATVPLYRAFIVNRIVKPENGPASRQLADAVEKDLLVREPYVSYGITLDQCFSSGDRAVWGDFLGLSDRLWGWNSNYEMLRKVGWEAVRRHPGTFVGSYLDHCLYLFTHNFEYLTPWQTYATLKANAPKKDKGSALPALKSGDLVPASHLEGRDTTPDGNIYYDWSDLASPQIRFRDPSSAERYQVVEARMMRMCDELVLHQQRGGALLANLLNRAAGCFPVLLLWVLAGFAGAVGVPKRLNLFLALHVCVVLAVLGASMLAVPHWLQYRIPFDPLFIVFGLVGVQQLLKKYAIDE